MSGASNIPAAAASDVGRRRDHNEDAVHLDPPLLVVADGVGGSAKGEVASRMAIDTFVAAASRIAEAATSDDAVRAMESAVLDANAAVHGSQLRDESRRGMATTITAAVVRDGGEVVVGHVGDSRLYVLSAAGARQVTHDHSVVAELVRTGRLAPGDVSTHPQRNVITRALGPEPDVTVDAFVAHVGPGDWLLACSDGLTEHVDDAELARLVVEHAAHDPQAAAQALVDLANERGGSDNITLALAQPVPSDVSGELRIEHLHAAAATTDQLRAVGRSDIPADASGPLPAVDPRALERSAELPRLEPIHDGDPWQPPARRGSGAGGWLLVTALVLLAVAAGAFVWSRSYFLVEREDGRVGIDRGFPTLGLSTPHRDSEVIAEELEPADRERLVDSHRILDREDAERVLDELPERLDSTEDPVGGTAAAQDATGGP